MYRANPPDLLVLDIMLPDMDGFGVLAEIRASGPYTPILFLTARDSVVDRVTGLTAGGDDYMTKPFSLEELVARLRGLLRRSAYLTPSDDETLRVGEATLRATVPALTDVAIDKPVRFSWDAERVVLFDKASGANLQHAG